MSFWRVKTAEMNSADLFRISQKINKMASMRQAFTMIELLMVILIVSALAAVSMSQFLDFRNEARIASIRSLIAAVRVGVSNQKNNARIRCGARDLKVYSPVIAGTSYLVNSGIVFNVHQVFEANDVTASTEVSGWQSVCTTGQITNAVERHFIDPATFVSAGSGVFYLDNPFTTDKVDRVGDCSSCSDRCSCNMSFSGEPLYSWCFVPETGEMWPATNEAGECSLSY